MPTTFALAIAVIIIGVGSGGQPRILTAVTSSVEYTDFRPESDRIDFLLRKAEPAR